MSHMDRMQLTKRERQIMDVVYKLGAASASQIQEGIPEAPGSSSVRTLIARLEAKGWLKHTQEGRRFVYLPTVPRAKARRNALAHLVRVFFDGSVSETLSTLIEANRGRIPEEEIDRMREMIEEARRRRSS
jgi:predicted transcriptional regulator